MTRLDDAARIAAGVIVTASTVAAIVLAGFLWAVAQVTVLLLFTMGGAL